VTSKGNFMRKHIPGPKKVPSNIYDPIEKPFLNHYLCSNSPKFSDSDSSEGIFTRWTHAEDAEYAAKELCYAYISAPSVVYVIEYKKRVKSQVILSFNVSCIGEGEDAEWFATPQGSTSVSLAKRHKVSDDSIIKVIIM
jgi:hypothetical protein